MNFHLIMKSLRIIIYLVVGLVFLGFVNAATIYGTVYDLSLKKANNARVEINTLPKQFMVAQNGTYSFSVPNGRYTIKAQLMQKNTTTASVQENITIMQDGSYVLDLILFPDVEEGVEDIGIDINGDVVDDKNARGVLLTVLIGLFVSCIIIGIIYYVNTRKKEENMPENENDLDQIIKIIKQEGGRATQKDIRKQIPLSDEKISLMIAELEHKGVIEKIKKGRGNIIILKKK